MNLQLARAWLERDHLGFPTSNILLCSAATARASLGVNPRLLCCWVIERQLF